MNEFRGCEGIEVVNLGRIATGALKGLAGIASIGDSEMGEMLSEVRGIRGLTVFSFDDCSQADKARICERLDRILEGTEVLLEASDEGEKVRICGVTDEEKGIVRDIMVYAPSSGALVCIYGTISMDSLARIAEND